MTTLTREAYEKWKLETKLVEDVLARIERAERVILTDLGCPTDLVAVYAILAGEQSPPWPTRTAARNKQRALHAMHTLALVAQARSHLHPGQLQPAVYPALLAGLYAGDAALNAVLGARTQERARHGGYARGKQKATASRGDDPAIAKAVKQWAISEELQDQYPSTVSYIHKKTKLSPRTIQRRLKRLRLSTKPRQ